MATALPNNPNIECSICLETFKTPKILSCGHSFCLECLVSYIDDRKETIPCPFCKQDVEIPLGGVDKFVTNYFLQFSTDSTSLKTKHYCPNHEEKAVEYYCQTCNLGLCSRCIFKDHNDHETLDLELDSTRENVVKKLSKYEQFLNDKLKDLENTHVTLSETSDKLKSFCEAACTKVSEQTENIIRELKENCKKIQKDIRDTFDTNDSKLTETRQRVMTQINNIKTDLETSRPTTETPSLTLIYSLTKLKELQKLCENIQTDINPPVTYVEWKEGSVKVCDILGSTVTKPLYESESNVFKFNYNDIKIDDELYFSEDKYESNGRVWGCRIVKRIDRRTRRSLRRWIHNRYVDINIRLVQEHNPQVGNCEIVYTLTILNNDKDKNVISKPRTDIFTPNLVLGEEFGISGFREGILIPWDKLTDPSEGFIDNEGNFLVRFDIIHQVSDIEYKNLWSCEGENGFRISSIRLFRSVY